MPGEGLADTYAGHPARSPSSLCAVLSLNYQPEHGAWFAANAVLFNHVAAFYFEVIQAHTGVLDLPAKEALTALEKLTHTTEQNPYPVMPLSEIQQDIPAMFRRAA